MSGYGQELCHNIVTSTDCGSVEAQNSPLLRTPYIPIRHFLQDGSSNPLTKKTAYAAVAFLNGAEHSQNTPIRSSIQRLARREYHQASHFLNMGLIALLL